MAATYSLAEEIVKLFSDYNRYVTSRDVRVKTGQNMEAGNKRDTNTSSVGINENEEDNVRTPFNNDLILTEIFSSLDLNTLKAIRLVNKQWSRVGGRLLSKRCKTIALCGTKASENYKDKQYWLWAYEGFETRRKGVTQDGGIIFSDYRIGVDNCRNKLPDVLKSSWAGNIKVLTISGLGPEEWDIGFTKALLASLPQLKELGFELDNFYGRDSVVEEFSREFLAKNATIGMVSGITKVHVGVSNYFCNAYDWNIIGFCPELEELSIEFAKSCNASKFLLSLAELAKVRKLRKVSLRHLVRSHREHALDCCMVRNSLGLVKGLRVSEVEFIMPATTAQAMNLVGNLDRDVRKLTCEINCDYDERTYWKLSRFLNTLSAQNYNSLKELVIIVKFEWHFVREVMEDGEVGSISLPSVKTLRIQQSHPYGHFVDKKLVEWIIKQLPTAFPNLKSLDLEMPRPTALKNLLKAGKKLESLEFLKLDLSYFNCSYKLREDHFFGTSSRRNAYHGFVDLKGLKTLEIKLPNVPSITAKGIFQGFSRMVALQRLSVSNIIMDEEAEADLKTLKTQLCRLELIPLKKN